MPLVDKYIVGLRVGAGCWLLVDEVPLAALSCADLGGALGSGAVLLLSLGGALGSGAALGAALGAAAGVAIEDGA